jgi:hypothetical protein
MADQEEEGRNRSEEMEGLRDWIGMSGRGYLRRPRSF